MTKLLPGIIIGFIAAIIIPSTCSVVPAGHAGISVTMGKVDKNIRAEGLTFKKPFVEKIVKVNLQQSTANDSTQCFSSDLQTITVAYSIFYRTPQQKAVELYVNYNGDPYNSLVKPRIEETLKQVAAKYRAEELVKNRDSIKMATRDKLRTELAGLLDITDVAIRNIDLSDELESAIEKKQVGEQQALAKEYDLRRAEIDAKITVVNAQAEAESVKIKGEALKSSPEVIQLEIAKKWDGKTPSSVVVGSGGANVLLPLKP